MIRTLLSGFYGVSLHICILEYLIILIAGHLFFSIGYRTYDACTTDARTERTVYPSIQGMQNPFLKKTVNTKVTFHQNKLLNVQGVSVHAILMYTYSMVTDIDLMMHNEGNRKCQYKHNKNSINR